MIEKIDQELKEIESMVEKLYENEMAEIVDVLNKHFQNICNIMLTFINSTDRYNELGLEIPKDVLINQVKNFMGAYEKQDVLMLADVMKYEINEGLKYYRAILIEMGENNEQ